MNDKIIFPDLPNHGPLARYRSAASFDWKKLKALVNDEEALILQSKVWSFMQNHREFQRDSRVLTMDEARQTATRRMNVMYKEKLYGIEDVIK